MRECLHLFLENIVAYLEKFLEHPQFSFYKSIEFERFNAFL